MEKVCFFTFVSDNYYYSVGTHILVNSFRYFHPDLDLIVFRQDMVDKIFEKTGVNFYNAKPTFAKLLTEKYDLVVNIDADTIILGRLDEVLKEDYDVGAAWNFNDYENASFDDITAKMYLQAGLVASRNKRFWDVWEEKNKLAHVFIRKENDVLNSVVYHELPDLKLKIFDKEKNYYGCKSLNREPEFYLEGKKVMCRGEQVKAYHHAKGADLPKLYFENIPFTYEVREWMKHVAFYGQSAKYVQAL